MLRNAIMLIIGVMVEDVAAEQRMEGSGELGTKDTCGGGFAGDGADRQ